MSVIDVFIALKITDNTARSALYALQNRMGMPFIKAVKRWDVWELELSGSIKQAEDCVKGWVENTALFLNPNKHIYKLQSGTAPLLEADNPPSFCQTQGSIFVYDREDGHSESVLQSLQKSQKNGQDVKNIMHGVWWDITFDDTITDGSKYIKELAATTHRTSGLFSNPHYQDVKLFLSK